jgi:hypothetical protein
MGGLDDSSVILELNTRLRLDGQFHFPNDLLLEKEHPMSFGKGNEWAP